MHCSKIRKIHTIICISIMLRQAKCCLIYSVNSRGTDRKSLQKITNLITFLFYQKALRSPGYPGIGLDCNWIVEDGFSRGILKDGFSRMDSQGWILKDGFSKDGFSIAGGRSAARVPGGPRPGPGPSRRPVGRRQLRIHPLRFHP